MMRILFTRFPYESVTGGAERQTQWLAAGLVKRGHSVGFLGQCRPLLTMLKDVGVETHVLTLGLPPVTMTLALSFLWRRSAMQKKLIAAVEALPQIPEVIVMLSLTEKILLTEWAAKKGIKVFWIEHDRIGRWLSKNPWLGVLKGASQFAKIVCVSELSRRMYIDLGFDAARVPAIPNGIPLPPSSPSQSPPTEERVGIKLGCIARLSPEKGIDVLIQSLAGLPEIDLTIVGAGSEEGYLRSLALEDATRIGVERIRIIQHIDDLESFYASLDAFVLPSSDHDPFGLVAAEAMARGIATVVTDACGIAGYLTAGKDALIAEAGSADSLQSALRTLRDPAVRKNIAEQGMFSATALFSVETMVDSYERAFGTP